jgi:hypothetical protein
MVMDNNKKDFMLSEYTQLNGFVSNAWTILFSILTGSIILYGYLVISIFKAGPTKCIYCYLLPINGSDSFRHRWCRS